MREINKYLDNLRRRLEPTEVQRNNILERVNRIRDVLEEDLYFKGSDYLNKKTYLQGSWLRKTMIRTKSEIPWDVDIMVIKGNCVPSSAPVYSESIPQPISVLERLKNHLRDEYPFSKMKPKIDFPCIVIEYAKDNFNLEIMPVYHAIPYYYNHNPERMFYIPDTYEKWKFSLPFDFDDKISKLNQVFDSKIKWLIKLIKHWNNTSYKLMSSYLIEYLTYEFFNNNKALADRELIILIYHWFKRAEEWLNKTDINNKFAPSISDGDGIFLDYIYNIEPKKWGDLKNNISENVNLLESSIEYIKKILPYI